MRMRLFLSKKRTRDNLCDEYEITDSKESVIFLPGKFGTAKFAINKYVSHSRFDKICFFYLV